MNFQAIMVANITGSILIFFLYVSRNITRTNSDTGERLFGVMMLLAFFACLIELITFAVDGKPGIACRYINLLGATYLYFANGIGSFLFCIYVDLSLYNDTERAKRIYTRFAFGVGALLISLFLNIPFGYYFYVDTDNVYHRQPMIYIFYVYLMLCIVYSVALYLVHKHRTREASFFPIYTYVVPIATASLLQMVFYGVSLAWLATAIGLVALYMSLQNQKTYKDAMTGLYNRLYLEHEIFVIKNNFDISCYGIMIDMNYFKAINDTYGHAAGDQALVDMGYILKKRFSGLGKCFRYAGDEFIVLVKSDSEDEIIEIENELLSDAESFNDSHKRPYKLSFSLGYGKFEQGKDDEESFLSKIDAAMYANKKEAHVARL